MKIEELYITARARTILKHLGITTTKELIDATLPKVDTVLVDSYIYGKLKVTYKVAAELEDVQCLLRENEDNPTYDINIYLKTI
jgi:predicted RecB family nuclease